MQKYVMSYECWWTNVHGKWINKQETVSKVILNDRFSRQPLLISYEMCRLFTVSTIFAF